MSHFFGAQNKATRAGQYHTIVESRVRLTSGSSSEAFGTRVNEPHLPFPLPFNFPAVSRAQFIIILKLSLFCYLFYLMFKKLRQNKK